MSCPNCTRTLIGVELCDECTNRALAPAVRDYLKTDNLAICMCCGEELPQHEMRGDLCQACHFDYQYANDERI